VAENEKRANHFKPIGLIKDFLKRRTFAITCKTSKSYEQSTAEKEMSSYHYSYFIGKKSIKLYK
jgi:hypothetical protein